VRNRWVSPLLVAAAVLAACGGGDDLAVPATVTGPIAVTYAGTGAIDEVFTVARTDQVTVLSSDAGSLYVEGDVLTYCDATQPICRRTTRDSLTGLGLAPGAVLEDAVAWASSVDWTDAATTTLAGRDARCLTRDGDEVSRYCYDVATGQVLGWRTRDVGEETTVEALEVTIPDPDELVPSAPVEDATGG
jgi:hypothetical protein